MIGPKGVEAIMQESLMDRFLERGEIKFLILASLNEGEKHGYQVIKDINQTFKGYYTPSPGVVYPTLEALEDEGYIKAEKSGKKKSYSMTAKGVAYLKKNQKRVDAVIERFGDCVKVGWSREVRRIHRNFQDIVFYTVNIVGETKGKNVGKKVKEKLGAVEAALDACSEKLEDIWEA